MNYGYYLCTCWQAFIQQIVHNVSHGYYYYHYHTLTENRRPKLPEIDKKIETRFATDRAKDKRYRAKKNGECNYFYLRYGLQLIIMRTDGNERHAARQEQRFDDIREVPLEIRIEGDGNLVLKLHRKAVNGISVCLSKACYRDKKVELLELVEHRRTMQVIYLFNMLNGIPAYSGVTEHKKLLLKEVLNAAKKHGVKLSKDDFRLKTKLVKYKVFVNEKPLIKQRRRRAS
ncbi:hypothetical protein ADMFC3_23580 [Geovibrio sp. ADMFC3]